MGAVPETATNAPTRTAREKPICGSKGEPDETILRIMQPSSPEQPGSAAAERRRLKPVVRQSFLTNGLEKSVAEYAIRFCGSV
mgnify:CR=1 FL=1